MSFLDTLLGKTGSRAANAAAADQYGKEQAATGAIRSYGDQYAQQFADLSRGFDPYVTAGNEAAGQFTNLLRDPSNVRSLPGYQFNLDQGTRALDNSAAARSGVMNGKLVKDQTRFATDYADTFYGNQFNRLMGATGQGQAATGAQVGTVGAGLQGQLNTRQSAYQGDMNSAKTVGQGMVAGANAESSALTNIMNLAGYLGGAALGGPMGGGMFGKIAGLFGNGSPGYGGRDMAAGLDANGAPNRLGAWS